MLDSEDYIEIISKKKDESKFDENGKRIRKNRDEQGRKKKYKKKGNRLVFGEKNYNGRQSKSSFINLKIY